MRRTADRERRARRGPARPRRHRRARARARSARRLLDRGARAALVGVVRRRGRPRAGEVDGVDYRFVDSRGVRAAARRRRLPRVVRGLRRPEGHARGAGRGAARGRRRRAARGRRAGRAGGPRRDARRAARVRAGRRRREVQRQRLLEPRGRRPPSRSSAGSPRPRPRRRSPTQFDAVVVNDDVDRAVARGRCYPEQPRRGIASSALTRP